MESPFIVFIPTNYYKCMDKVVGKFYATLKYLMLSSYQNSELSESLLKTSGYLVSPKIRPNLIFSPLREAPDLIYGGRGVFSTHIQHLC